MPINSRRCWPACRTRGSAKSRPAHRLEIIGLTRQRAAPSHDALVIAADLRVERRVAGTVSAGNSSMATPRTLILRAPGTNCDVETAYAFERAGAAATTLHVNRALENPRLLDEFQILCIPGGFSYGDDVAAGRIFGNQIRHHLAEQLHEFRERQSWCWASATDFRVLLRSGILFEDLGTADNPPATLAWNDSGKFEDRWVRLNRRPGRASSSAASTACICPWPMPRESSCARDAQVLARAGSARPGRAALCRAGRQPWTHGAAIRTTPTGRWPASRACATRRARVCGFMPHPERHIDRTQHPRWTRGEGVGRRGRPARLPQCGRILSSRRRRSFAAGVS